MIDLKPEPWMRHGACRGLAHDDAARMFFPARGESTEPAKAVCARCPVRAECLEYALRNHEKFGIFGGKSERERRQIRQQRREQAQREAAERGAA